MFAGRPKHVGGTEIKNTRTRGIFVTERAGTPFRKLFLRKMQAGTAFRNIFFPAIDITRLGVSCYPTALLSNKLA
jgi:hypothetical protein